MKTVSGCDESKAIENNMLILHIIMIVLWEALLSQGR